MLTEYRTLVISTLVVGGAVMAWSFFGDFDGLTFLILNSIGSGIWLVGHFFLAVAKGYPVKAGWLGVLPGLGLIVLLLIPDNY